jgi:hypothetical protein
MRDIVPRVEDLWVLVHSEHGPISTFLTEAEAARELARVLWEEPTWKGDVWIEPFRLVVAEPSRR